MTQLVEFPGAVDYVQPAPRSRNIDVIALAEDYWRLAQRISNTEFVPVALRRRPEAVLAALLSGAERGLGPMESLRSINVIEGRPNLSAEAMRALVFAAGHTIEVIETSDRKAAVTGRRAGSETSSPPFVWTIDKARRARLASKDNWVKYPESMLLARATADLCRALFPDVVAGLAVTEEVLDEIAPAPETRTSKRPRTAPQTPPVAAIETTVAEPAPKPPQPSYRSERTEAEMSAVLVNPVRERIPQMPPMVDAENGETPYGDEEDDSTPWAPKPDTTPADPKLGRRIHAAITDATPNLTANERDQVRHGLVAVVTRRRDDGPVTSSNDLDYEEQLALTQLIGQIRSGRATVTFGIDNDTLELRAHGWRYDISTNPPVVTVARPPATDPPVNADDEQLTLGDGDE